MRKYWCPLTKWKNHSVTKKWGRETRLINFRDTCVSLWALLLESCLREKGCPTVGPSPDLLSSSSTGRQKKGHPRHPPGSADVWGGHSIPFCCAGLRLRESGCSRRCPGHARLGSCQAYFLAEGLWMGITELVWKGFLGVRDLQRPAL